MNKLNATYIDSISNISEDVWAELGCEEDFYFNRGFLAVFEATNQDIQQHYLLIEAHYKPIAIAVIQTMDVALDNATENVPLSLRISRFIQCYLNDRKLNVMVCGNVFLSGPYGLFVKKDVDETEVYDFLAGSLKKLKTTTKPSVFFMKDFGEIKLPAAQASQNHQFQPFSVEPNMVLQLRWKDFESYKKSLKSKYRVKVNKADSRSENLELRTLDAQQILDHASILQRLYLNITDKAMFNAVELNVKIYAGLKERFRESIVFNTYWNDNTLVAFATAFKVGNRLEAHFIGLDYQQNKELALYPRILNDYVRLGLFLGVKEVNLGRTASEIKSTLGAEPEYLVCFVKHRRTVANLIFKPLIRQLKMTEYKQHQPFKK